MSISAAKPAFCAVAMQTQCLAETAVVPLRLLKPAVAVCGAQLRHLMTAAAAQTQLTHAMAVGPVVHAQPEDAAIDVYANAPQRMTLRGRSVCLLMRRMCRQKERLPAHPYVSRFVFGSLTEKFSSWLPYRIHI